MYCSNGRKIIFPRIFCDRGEFVFVVITCICLPWHLQYWCLHGKFFCIDIELCGVVCWRPILTSVDPNFWRSICFEGWLSLDYSHRVSVFIFSTVSWLVNLSILKKTWQHMLKFLCTKMFFRWNCGFDSGIRTFNFLMSSFMYLSSSIFNLVSCLLV